MDQAKTQRFHLKRLRGKTAAWLSKPANVILLIFSIILILLTLYPLLSMLLETFTIHVGREARAAKQTAGSLSLYHFQRLFATAETNRMYFRLVRVTRNATVPPKAMAISAAETETSSVFRKGS